jgi:hypothetical protein
MRFWFGGAGWLLYFAGSVGYMLADCLSRQVPEWLFLLLALVFVVDALMYLMVWRADAKAAVDLWCWSELVNVAASVFCAVAAGLYLSLPLPGDTALAAQTFLQLQSGLYFTGTTLFFLNALMSLSLYRAEPGVPMLRDVAFWAEIFNTLPGAGYWATSVLQLVCYVQMVTLHDSSSALYQASVEILRLVRSVNIAFDFMYILDAGLYAYVWICEHTPDTPPVTVRVFRPGDYGAL